MSHMMEPAIGEDMEKLAFLSGQQETVGQTSKDVKEMEDQNFILIKNETAVSRRSWTCDKEEDGNKDGGETFLSHAKEELVLELKEAELKALKDNY